jgi:DNA polymerase-1
MCAYGLSEDLNISRNEAETFIKKYILVYPEVKEFLDEQIKWAQKEGYVETIFKRRRYIPELKSPVFTVREFGKRTSMNAPIQGSAADIIKIAMVKLALYLKTNNLKSKILLQVHDELILEVPNEEEEIILQALKEIMEKAVELKVKLTVNVSKGESWYQL